MAGKKSHKKSGKSRGSKTSSRRRDRSTSSSSNCSSDSSKERLRQNKKIRRLEQKLSKLSKSSTYIAPNANLSIDETLIPIFDPNANIMSALEWSIKIDELKMYHKWNDALAIKLAACRLRGNARKWYDSLREKYLTWEELKVQLIDTFPRKINFGKLLVEAANYAPKRNANLGDYCFEKVSKLNKLNLVIPEDYVIDSVIEGLDNETNFKQGPLILRLWANWPII